MNRAEGFYQDTLWSNGSNVILVETMDTIYQTTEAEYMIDEDTQIEWTETDRVPYEVMRLSQIKLFKRSELEHYGRRDFGSRNYYTASDCTTVQCLEDGNDLVDVEYEAADLAQWEPCKHPCWRDKIFNPFKDPVILDSWLITRLDGVGSYVARIGGDEIKLDQLSKLSPGEKVRSLTTGYEIEYATGMPLDQICHVNALIPGVVVEGPNGPEIIREMGPKNGRNVLGLRPTIYEKDGRYLIAVGRYLYIDPIDNSYHVDELSNSIQVDRATYLRILNGEKPETCIIKYLASMVPYAQGEAREQLIQEVLKRLK